MMVNVDFGYSAPAKSREQNNTTEPRRPEHIDSRSPPVTSPTGIKRPPPKRTYHPLRLWLRRSAGLQSIDPYGADCGCLTCSELLLLRERNHTSPLLPLARQRTSEGRQQSTSSRLSCPYVSIRRGQAKKIAPPWRIGHHGERERNGR